MSFIEFRKQNLEFDPFNVKEMLDYAHRTTGSSHAYPFKDFKNGKIGFVTFYNDRKIILENQMFPIPLPVRVHALADMDRILYDNLTMDYPIYLWEEPHSRVTGFIVLKNSGAKWFHCDLNMLLA